MKIEAGISVVEAEQVTGGLEAVAIGEPVLLLAVFLLTHWVYIRFHDLEKF